MTMPWVSFFYIENISGAALSFTLRKFFENPALITLLASFNVAFNFLVGVVTSYLSDRIWTRWGRRRPFLITGWLGVGVTLAFVPLAPNAWVLAVLIVLYQFFQDVAKPLEPLYNEVVPPAQRGRAVTVRSIAQNLMNLVFFGVLIAQFDRVYDLGKWGAGLHLTGEQVVYWTGSALIVLAALFLLLFVRERQPVDQPAQKQCFALMPFLRDVFGHRQWWTVYLLYSIPLLATTGMNELEPLMRTEQLGFSKAAFGSAVSIGLVINIAIFIPLAGFLTDRMPRLLMLQCAIVAFAAVNFLFFLYLRYVADYQISLMTLIVFGIIATAFKSCIYIVWGPMVYDYIPSARFGTVAAGFAFIGGITPFLLMNLTGLWINGFTALFGTRGGSTFDYSSIYVLQVISVGGALLLMRYIRSEERAGRLKACGRMEIARTAD